MYLAQDIPAFIMYSVYGATYIESIDSMIGTVNLCHEEAAQFGLTPITFRALRYIYHMWEDHF